MNVVIIIITSLLIFFAIRALAILVYMLVFKITKIEIGDAPILTSVAMLIIFMTLYLSAANTPSIKEKLTNQEWYAFYVILGGLGIIWSYVQWKTNSFKSLPKLETEKDRMAIKKMVIFSLMFLYSVRGGYEQVINSLAEKKTDAIYIITNTAIIGCMIAMDRVMNQIHTLYILKRDEKEKRKSELQGVN